MSFDIQALIEGVAGQSLREYQRRASAAVGSLAASAGLDVSHEVQRFDLIMEQLRAGSSESKPSEGLGGLQAAVIEQMPNVVELVLTHADGDFRGFGYLSEGKPRNSLPETLRFQLENGLRAYLSHGGPMSDAGTLADVFGLLFPNLDSLAGHSAMAQAMLLGFVPRGQQVGMKVYFNTRILGGVSHRERVVRCLDYLGLGGASHYDALYGGIEGLSFVGVGLDLDGSPGHRAKLYVRMPRERVTHSLPALLRVMGLSGTDEAGHEAQAFLHATQCSQTSDEAELAIGLNQDGFQTLKLTTFFSDAERTHEPVDLVGTYLAHHDYHTGPYEQAVKTLTEGASEPNLKKQPVHGVGIEYPVGDRPKVNVYLTPLF
ncbi:MAG: hypothetical protein VX834_01805 [Myxococcota bacterium]|nr:hypothetical protein [Myxococcota bacterium]